jgi:DNA-binding transcriptional regulator YiaG
MVDDDAQEVKRLFGLRFSKLRRGYPQADWAKRYGLSAGAVRDLEQGRVLPSRAMVVLMHAIRMQPEFMQRAAKEAGDELALLDLLRAPRN